MSSTTIRRTVDEALKTITTIDVPNIFDTYYQSLLENLSAIEKYNTDCKNRSSATCRDSLLKKIELEHLNTTLRVDLRYLAARLEKEHHSSLTAEQKKIINPPISFGGKRKTRQRRSNCKRVRKSYKTKRHVA
jgi:hypothetical protein